MPVRKNHDIINIAHALGREGFVDKNEEDVFELIITSNQNLDKQMVKKPHYVFSVSQSNTFLQKS